jgi:hypothetical protein
MLSENSYKREYIEACRARIAAQVAAYDQLSAVDPDFEPAFFNNMVIVLGGYFANRMRGMEGKDGNPLNEVRVLTNSMMNNDERLAADSTISWDASRTVLGLHVGDRIALTRDDFVRLSDAFFAELEAKYPVAE